MLMRISGFASVFALFVVLAASTGCQKEVSLETGSKPDTTLPIIGNWAFTGINATSMVSLSGQLSGLNGKIEYLTDILSKNNSGTLAIDSFTMDLGNLSYSIDTVSKVNTYINNLL